ncbi:MAG: hypothetical protein HUK17_06055 [Bacteroidales bacterium]|nr:hypothetical protein [Bacteroidales bacterium]
MKNYLVHLLVFSAALAVAAVALKFTAGFSWLLPIAVLYFAVVTGVSHSLTLKSMQKEARLFVKNFLLLSVGTMMLHLVIIFCYAIYQMFVTKQIDDAKRFIVAFAVLFVVYLVFETLELILFIRKQKKEQDV